MGGTATDGSCAMVGGVSRSVPSSPGERSEKFTKDDGSQGCLDGGTTEIRFQNKSAKERRSLLVRSKEALDMPTIPQISVWAHCDSQGVRGVWTGRGPSDHDTGIWSSDPDSGAQLSSASLARQASLDHRHPYHAVPSLNTPSPPDTSTTTFSPPRLSKPKFKTTFPKVPSLVVQSSQSTDQQFSSDELRSFSGEKEEGDAAHICRCRSSEPLSVSWGGKNNTKSSSSPLREQFPLRNSSPQSPGSTTTTDILPSVRTVNQMEPCPTPGSAPWHIAAQAESDSKNFCKKTLP